MAPTAPFGDQHPIVGREREQARLGDLLSGALNGVGNLALLSGEAGIGKTTLVRALVQQARERGALVLSGGCYDLTTTPPYSPWTEAMQAYQPVEGLPSIPSWFGDLDEVEKLGSQAALFEEARRFFSGVAEAQPLVIVLEDLHWSDQASIDLLRYLSHRIGELGALIVVTYRDDELTRRHPFFQHLSLVVQETDAARIELQRLDTDAVRELVTPYGLSEAETGRLVAYLEQRAAGNPFFTTELLRALESEGVLHVDGAVAWLGELDESYLPSFVLQVIERRLARLDGGSRQALEIAAVIGQEVPFNLWESVSDLGPSILDQAIEQALEIHVMEETVDRQRLVFTHALVRDVLYEGVLPTHRRLWHRQVGDSLIRMPGADPDIVAYHFQQAGDARAIEWLIRAGLRAERRFALVMAARHFEAAQALLEGDASHVRVRGWLLLRSGWLLLRDDWLRWSYPERGGVHALLTESGRLAAMAGDQVLAAYSLFLRGSMGQAERSISHQTGAVAEMEAGIAAIDALSPTDQGRTETPLALLVPDAFPVDTASLSAGEIPMPGRLPGANYFKQWLVAMLASRGRNREAIAMGGQHVAQVTAATTDEALVQAACLHAYRGLGGAYAAVGQPDEARRWLRLAGMAVAAVGDYASVASVLLQEMNLLITYHTEQVVERRELAMQATQAARYAVEARATEHTSTAGYHSPVAWVDGRWTEVWEGASASEGNWAWQVLGRLAHAQGQSAGAWALVHKTLPRGPATEPGESWFYYAIDVQRLAIELALDAGDLPLARQWLEMHDRWLEWSGSVPGRAESQLLWAHYHRPAGDVDAVRRHAERALERASNPRQPLALIASHRFLGQLDTEARQYGDAAEHLQVSLELAEKCEAPYEQALTTIALAELWLATGHHEAVGSLLEQARELCIPLGAKPALARIENLASRFADRTSTPSSYPHGLTPREAEVLRLIAAGRSNREIAEALFLSPRTVERHIANIYLKIDVHTKAEATAYARRQHLT